MSTRTDVLQIRLETTGDGKVKASLAEVSAGIEKVDRSAGGASEKLSKFSVAGAAIGTILTGTAIAAFNTVREVERLRAVLTTLEGSQAGANSKFRELRDLAAETPYSINQLVEAYSALKARGLDPGREALIAYGNVASGMGKNIMQFVEAVGDAATGEFERLKEFGIIARSEGDKVALTFRGVTTTVGKSAEEIEQFLQNIGKNEFGGAMAVEMDTINGAVSNLLDNIDRLLTAMGDSGLTSVTTDLIKAISDAVLVLSQMIERTDSAGNASGFLANAMEKISAIALVVVQSVKMMGVVIGAGIEILAAYKDAWFSLGTAVLTYYETMGKAVTLDFSGARDTLSQGIDATLGGLEAAQQRAATALSTMSEMGSELRSELADKIALIGLEVVSLNEKQETLLVAVEKNLEGLEHWAEVFGVKSTILSGLIAQINKALDTHGSKPGTTTTTTTRETEIDKQIRQTEKYIETLQRQVDTYGLDTYAMIEYTRAQQLASAATSDQKQRINDLTNALITKMKADEILTRNTAEFAEQMQQLSQSTQTYTQLQQQLSRQFESDSAAAAREYADALRTIADYEQQLLQLGPMTAEQQQQIAQARQLAAQAYEQSRVQAVEAARRSAYESLSAAEQVLYQGADDLSMAITDGLLSGDWDDVGRRLADSLVGGMIDTFLQQNLTQPLQQMLMGDTGSGGMNLFGSLSSFFSGRGFETGSDFVGPPAALAGQGGGSGQLGQYFQSGVMGYSIGGMLGSTQAAANMGLVGGVAGQYIGSQLGSFGGPIGTIIGSILGSLIGDLFGSKPSLEVSSRASNINRSRVEATGTSALGSIYAGVDNTDFDATEFVAQLVELDNAIAAMLNATELQAARDALASFDANQRGDFDPVEIINQRVNAIIAAVEPAFAAFLTGIEDVEERMKQFEGIRAVRDYIESLDDAIAELDLTGDPVAAVIARINRASGAVGDAMDTLAQAIERQDAAAIAQAGQAAVSAVIERYNTEISLVQELEAALLNAEREARAINLQLEQRIAALTGDPTAVTQTAFTNMATLRVSIGTARTPEQAMAFLDEFVATVDTWLQSAIAGVHRLADAERARVSIAMQNVQAALTALASERDAIMAGAQARAAEANAAAQQAAQAAQQAQQAQIEALQQQLTLAQQWVAVLDQAQGMIDSLTLGTSNPLEGFGRLALLDERIRTAQGTLGSASGAAQSEAASALLQLLQERLSLVQGEGLYDRSSAEYLALYNETLQRIGAVQAMAEPEADRALELQQMIADLQAQTVGAVSVGTSTAVQLSASEQARLDEIAAEEALLNKQMYELELEMAAINKEEAEAVRLLQEEAAGYYRWAQGEAQRIQAEQQQLLRDQIDAITGGRPIDVFMAERARDTVLLLQNIRDDMRGFLSAISGVPITGSTAPGYDGSGYTPAPPVAKPKSVGDASSAGINVVVNVSGAGDPKAVAAAVQAELSRSLPQMATQLKRELDYA